MGLATSRLFQLSKPNVMNEITYPTESTETLAEAPSLRVRRIALGHGQCVPWHYHSQVTDTFFCMRGPMQVKTRSPDEMQVLQAGGTYAVKAGTAHYVSGVDGRPLRIYGGAGNGRI